MAKREAFPVGHGTRSFMKDDGTTPVVPVSLTDVLEYLAHEISIALSQGVYVGLSVTRLNDVQVTYMKSDIKEKAYLEQGETAEDMATQLRDALEVVTRVDRRGRR
jgi:hypothetical protein